MNVLGTAIGMGFHGTLGAAATTDFGKKGMVAGGVFGAGAFLLGEKMTEDDPGVTGAIASGFLTGSLQSAFSSAQEIYAFHNPGHISNVSSINTTTSATAIAQSMYHPFTQEGKDQWKELRGQESAAGNGKLKGRLEASFDMFNTTMLTPENTLTDATRMSMIANDIEGGADKMMRLLGMSRDEGKFSPVGALKGQYQDMWEAAKVADDGGVWFSNKAQTIDVEQKTFFGQKLDKDGNKLMGTYFNQDGVKLHMPDETEVWGMGKEKWMKENNIDASKTVYHVEGEAGPYGERNLKLGADGKPIESKPHTTQVNLTGNETIAERMGMYLDANKNAYDNAIKFQAGQAIQKGGNPRFKDFDSYRNYVTSMDGGALGTYQELKRAGFYDADAPKMKKAMAYATENMYGSPQWARTLDKQLTDGTATLENYTNDKGQHKVKIKGGGKRRAMGLIADIAMGGGINAALNVGVWAVAQPFSKGGGSHAVQSNNALNPI